MDQFSPAPAHYNTLPYAAINFATSSILEEESRSSAKAMVNLLVKKTRTEASLLFLGA